MWREKARCPGALGVFRYALDAFDLDEVRIAGGAVDGAAGQNDLIPRLKAERLLRGLARVIEQHVGRVEFLTQHRQHAP